MKYEGLFKDVVILYMRLSINMQRIVNDNKNINETKALEAVNQGNVLCITKFRTSEINEIKKQNGVNL